MKGSYNTKVLIAFLCLLFLLPSVFSAEGWGEGGGTVGDWLDLDLEEGNLQLDERSPKTEGTVELPLEENDSLASGNDQSLFLLSLQMFAALAFVILLIYALLKFVNKRSRSFNSHSTIESIGGVGLGANRSVQIVRMGSKLYLVGVGDSVQLLKEINDPDEVDKILEEHRPQDGIEQPIAKITDWIRERWSTQSSSSKDQPFQHLLDRELKGVKETQDKVHTALKEKGK